MFIFPTEGGEIEIKEIKTKDGHIGIVDHINEYIWLRFPIKGTGSFVVLPYLEDELCQIEKK